EEGRRAKVALKKLNELDGGAIYAFKQEFRALSDVAHPNLVGLHELFSVGSDLYISMELIDGIGLVDYVRGDLRPLDLQSLAPRETPRPGGEGTGTCSPDPNAPPAGIDEPPPPPSTMRKASVPPPDTVVSGGTMPPPPAPPAADFDFEGLRATLRQLAA